MPSLHIATDIDLRVRSAESVGKVVVDLGRFGSIHLEPDRTHVLIDELREALRALAEAEAHQLHRDEVAIRSAAEFREDH
ncbi:hypothetical protein [Rhodococcus pyridinivorans]|uniref:Uncharacterized protein n=1 Tax=Rhodococcus pyridinivorans TaxID=103816 RepID=A0A7M2XHC6_9NOCA|nr:hypothetical protein [Rhodococcus pyridinivorans]QOV97236.1 hypothetical protein INP59_14800 [Rhodococcus pyridinivorans]